MSRRKNYLFVDILRDIAKKKGRFLVLVLLTALGIGCFVGFRGSVPLMEQWMSTLFQEQNMMSLKVDSVLGFSLEEMEALRQLDSSLQVDGGYSYQRMVDTSVLQIISYSSKNQLNQLLLLEGRFPEQENECLVHPNFLEKSQYNIGDRIYVEESDTILKREEFLIVGTAHSPLFIAPNLGTSALDLGQVNAVLYLEESVFLGDYTQVYLGNIPVEKVEEVQRTVKELGLNVWDEKSTLFLQESAIYVEQCQNNLQTELELQNQLEEETSIKVIESQEAVAKAWREYQEKTAQLSPEEMEILRLDITSLQDNHGELLLEQQVEQREGQEKRTNLEKLLSQAQRDFQILKNGSWVVTTREDNTGYQVYLLDGQQLKQLANVFPVIFFAVTACVCWGIMIQMVEEQRNSIGTLRSLGYTTGQIILKYLIYAFLVWILATILGLIFGLYLIPSFIYLAWTQVYVLPAVEYAVLPWISIPAVLLASLVLGVSVVLACLQTVFSDPATLLRQKAPKSGGKVFLEYIHILWHDLTFEQKITLRNIFRDPKRFFTTIISVGVVTGVSVSAFGMGDALTEAMRRQYVDLYRHTTQIKLRQDVTPEEKLEVNGVLAGQQLSQSYTEFFSQSILATNPLEDVSLETSLYTVEDDEELGKTFYLRQTVWKPYILPKTGAIIPIKVSEQLNLNLGDTIELTGEFGTISAMVTAISEFYADQNIFMTHNYYEHMTGETPYINEIWADYQQLRVDTRDLRDEINRHLLSLDGVAELVQREDQRNSYVEGIKTMEYTIYAMISCACILVFVVLNYLNHSNLTRRKGELSTLKVLGFTDYELSAYIYKENIILTFYGVLLGMFIGQNFHFWLIRSIELPLTMLFRGVAIGRFFSGAGLTVFIAIIVNVYMYFHLKAVNMTLELRGTSE